MKFCEECGTKLEPKYLDGEGMIDYCSNCQKFVFKKYSVAVILIVISVKTKKVLLIKQYNKDKFILIAGYINQGESAEEALVRELKEEVSLIPISWTFKKTKYFEKSNTLMLNYVVYVNEDIVNVNHEVDYFEWFDLEAALNVFDKTTLAYEFYKNYYDTRCNDEI